MLKKSLIAASLALLAIGMGRPASAAPTFLESYTDIFDARTLLQSADDKRPISILQSRDSKVKDPTTRWVFAPSFRTVDLPGSADVTMWGGSLAYAASAGKRPFQLGLDLATTEVNVGGQNSRENFTYAPTLKFGLLGSKGSGPAASFVARYADVDGWFHRYDLLLAVDQKLGSGLYLTGNVGYGNVRPDGGNDTDDILGGVGATWRPARWPKLSLSANYVFENDVDGRDTWGVSAQWALDKSSLVRLGSGREHLWLANIIWKFDK